MDPPISIRVTCRLPGRDRLRMNVREFRDLEVGDHLFQLPASSDREVSHAREVIETRLRLLGPVYRAGRAELEIFDAEVLAHLAINRAREERAVRRRQPGVSLISMAERALRHVRIAARRHACAHISGRVDRLGRRAAVAVRVGRSQRQQVLALNVRHEDRDVALC